MNHEELEKLFRGAKDTKLDEKKKYAIGREVLLFMKKNPLQGTVLHPALQGKNTWFGAHALNIFTLKRVNAALASLLLVILVGGVASAKAESALPGDFLYLVKGFNEKVMVATAFSDVGKANINILLAERRLQEIEKLIIEKRANSANEAELNEKFKVQANKVAERIKTLNEKKLYSSAMEATSNFESLVRAHSSILKNLENSENKDMVSSLSKEVQKNIKDFADVRLKTQSEIINDNGDDTKKSETTVQDGLKSAQDAILDARKFIKNKKNKVEGRAASEAESNLNTAEQKISKGKNSVELKDYNDAFSSFQDAAGVARETRNLIRGKNNLNLNMNIEINENTEGGQNSENSDTINNIMN